MVGCAITIIEPHNALKAALRSIGSYGDLSRITGYSGGYWCAIARGKKKLTTRAAKKLIEKFPQITAQVTACPTCGQALP